MAKKDFDEYYSGYYKMYRNAVEELENYGTLAKDNLMSEEDMKLAKEALNPIFESWNFLNYVKFILDKPNRKSKKAKYEKQNQNKIKNSKYTEEKLKENAEQTIKDFKRGFNR